MQTPLGLSQVQEQQEQQHEERLHCGPSGSFSLSAPISFPAFFLLEHRAGAPALPGAQTCPAQSEDPMIRSGVNSQAQSKHHV